MCGRGKHEENKIYILSDLLLYVYYHACDKHMGYLGIYGSDFFLMCRDDRDVEGNEYIPVAVGAEGKTNHFPRMMHQKCLDFLSIENYF